MKTIGRTALHVQQLYESTKVQTYTGIGALKLWMSFWSQFCLQRKNYNGRKKKLNQPFIVNSQTGSESWKCSTLEYVKVKGLSDEALKASADVKTARCIGTTQQ